MFHPFKLVSSLVRLGYEPLPATRRYSIFAHRYFWYYPSMLTYTRHIVRDRGWMALYTGAWPCMVAEIVHEVMSDMVVRPMVHSLVNKLPLREIAENGDTPDTIENLSTTRATLVRAVRGFLIISFSQTLTEVVVRPFNVIALRAMAQYVGRETVYSGHLSAVREIYAEEGLLGFYSGIIPAVLGHIASVLLYEVIIVVMEEVAKLIPSAVVRGGIVILKVPIASYVTKSYMYPFYLVSTVMAVNSSNLMAASTPIIPKFASWQDCWKHLSEIRGLYRGNALLFPRFAYGHPKNKFTNSH